ncbi:hypothetical protein WH5701_06100 [Synechococcus sp. WH 5701]|nr:hypothetical protein WH5701_06100 [Synechococcus sp. WH 5701]
MGDDGVETLVDLIAQPREGERRLKL